LKKSVGSHEYEESTKKADSPS